MTIINPYGANEVLSPWPMTVEVFPDELVSVTGVSGNSYVVLIDGKSIGLESPTTASEAKADTELPSLYLAYKEANP